MLFPTMWFDGVRRDDLPMSTTKLGLLVGRVLEGAWRRERHSLNLSPHDGSQAVSIATRRGGLRRILPSCRSWCANKVFTEGGGLSLYLVAARTGMDWVHRTRLSRAGQPSIALMLRTDTARVCQVYRCTTHRFAHQRVFQCRRQPRKLPE